MKYLSLRRIAGIECTLSVFQLHDEADHNDIVLRKQVADLVFILLPKIFSTLKNVATGDETLGETLIVVWLTRWKMSFELVANFIFYLDFHWCSRSCIMFGVWRTGWKFWQLDYQRNKNFDRKLFEKYSGESTKLGCVKYVEDGNGIVSKNQWSIFFSSELPKKSSSIDENLKAIQSKQRNSDWLCAASLKILPMIQLLHKLTGSKSHKIRQALYELSDILLRRCQK